MAQYRTIAYNAKKNNPGAQTGKKFRSVPARQAFVSATMANNDDWILGGPFTFDTRISRLVAWNGTPGLTAAVVNLGFFSLNTATGLFVPFGTANELVSAGTGLQAAVTTAYDYLLAANTTLDTTKTIGELLNKSNEQEPTGGVFLGMRFTTKPSVNGTLDLEVQYEEATFN